MKSGSESSTRVLGGVIYAFCFLVVSTFFGSPLLIAVHRRIIVGSNPDQGYFASFFSQTFLWFWLTALGIGVLRLAHPRLTFGVLDISGFSQPILILVVLVLFVVPLVLSVIAVRFGIILPAIAIGGPNASLKAAWIGLREVYMRVWLGALGIFFTFAILYRLIEKFGPDPESSYLMFMVYMGLWDFVVVLNLMVAASFMSHVFLRCPQELTRSRLPLEGGSGEV